MANNTFPYTLISIFIIFVIICSCQSRQSEGTYSIQSESSFPDQFLENISFFALDDTQPLSTILNVEYIKGYYYIHASNGLFKYSKEGSFVRQISRKGRAEQEWLNLGAFCYSKINDDLCLIDAASSKIIHYSLDGDFLYAEYIEALDKTPVFHAVEVEDGILMSGSVFNENNVIYLMLSYEGNRMVELKDIPFKSDNIVYGIGRHPMNAFKDSVRCFMPFDNRLYGLSKRGLYPQSAIPIIEAFPPKKILKKYRNSFSLYSMVGELIANHKFCGYDGLFETERWLLLDSFNYLFTIIDKNTRDCWILMRDKLMEKISFPVGDFYSSSGDTLIAVSNVDRLQDFIERSQRSLLSRDSSERIEDFLSDNPLAPESNIIVLYKLSGQ